jgi:hypothetical protein
MAEISKTIATVEELTWCNGVDGLLVTFTDQSFVFWTVECEAHAREIKALAGETISFSLESDDFPEYWLSGQLQ